MHPGERLNSITHLVGSVAALVGSIVLIAFTAGSGILRVIAFSVYGATLLFLYVASTLYHSLRGRAKQIFRRLDHIGIYLLIAGTYTPFAIVMLGGAWGWSMFGVVWALAITGIVVEVILRDRAKPISSVLYLVMGWISVAMVRPLVEALDASTLVWIAAGGILYTAGFGITAIKTLKIRHELWHFFVLGGSTCHFVAMLQFVATR